MLFMQDNRRAIETHTARQKGDGNMFRICTFVEDGQRKLFVCLIEFVSVAGRRRNARGRVEMRHVGEWRRMGELANV